MNRDETEIRDRGMKPKSKKQRIGTEKRRERKAASLSASDVSQSEDSEEDMTLCPAESCLQPEGEEVSECTKYVRVCVRSNGF